jgi:outer membrane protein assembly factor BamB
MTSISVSLRTLALCSLPLAGSGCVPGSLSLGEEGSETGSESSDDATDDPAADAVVRWSTIRPDISGIDVAVAPDGSIYVVGQSGYTPQGDGGTFDDFWLAKHAADGALVWEVLEPLSEESYVYPEAVAVDDAGDVYLAMVDYSTSAGFGNRVRKLDPDGEELWSVEVPGRVFDVAALPGGGAIMVGAQETLAWAQRIEVDGTLGWSRSFGDSAMQYSVIEHAAITADGGVVLGGRMGLEPASSRSYAWAAALDVADGAERWQTPLSEGVVTEWVMGVGIAADGTALVAGWSDDRWVKALDPTGVEQWSWPNELAPGTTSIAVFPDGGFAVADGITLDIDDPDACFDPSGPCPSIMRIERLEADRERRWSYTTDECRVATVVVPTADGGLLALAGCGEHGSAVGVGLFQLEP